MSKERKVVLCEGRIGDFFSGITRVAYHMERDGKSCGG